MSHSPLTYRQAGVDIDAGDALVENIKAEVGSFDRPGLMGQIGGFGALFDPRACGYNDGVLVAATDGVGTKLLAALEANQLQGLGQDLVAMCINDLICQGAEPLFFLDYFATGRLEPPVARTIVASIANACKSVNCALIGGETAEMPGLYADGHFDLSGFAIGMVERDQILPRQTVHPGDMLYALPSNGVHSNGFSLARATLKHLGLSWQDEAPWEPSRTIAEDLLRPTHLYWQDFQNLRSSHGKSLKALAHITGGGIPGNLMRVLPDNCTAYVQADAWQHTGFANYLITQNLVERDEAFRTFNMGIGMIAIIDSSALPPENFLPIGQIQAGHEGKSCQILH